MYICRERERKTDSIHHHHPEGVVYRSLCVGPALRLNPAAIAHKEHDHSAKQPHRTLTILRCMLSAHMLYDSRNLWCSLGSGRLQNPRPHHIGKDRERKESALMPFSLSCLLRATPITQYDI